MYVELAKTHSYTKKQ